MINKDLILNSEVYDYPWEHQIVDNIIDAESFNRIRSICKHLVDRENIKKYPLLTKKMKQACMGSFNLSQSFHVYDLINAGVSEDTVELLHDISQEFLEITSEIHSKYSNPRFFDNYQAITQINMDFQGVPRDVHDEYPIKSVSVVIYLDPEENEATALHLDESDESIVKIPEWKLNRGLIFCGEENKTWHSCKVKENKKIRFAFCVFLVDVNAAPMMISPLSPGGRVAMRWVDYKFSNSKVAKCIDMDYNDTLIPYEIQMKNNFNGKLTKK